MRLTSKCLAVALSALFAATPAMPVNAMPLPAVTVQPVASGDAVQLVEHRRYIRRHWHGHRHWGERRYYRHRHRHHHSNAWVPFAILGMGAMIGGAVANDRGYGGSHVRWCANRYRSYRAYDNTFQPYNGPRRQCHSPYR
jgi:hypothetical protein